DAEAKEIISKLEEMIEVHQVPIEEIEKQEKDRIQGHKSAIEEIVASRSRLGVMGQKLSSSELKLKLESLEKFADRDFEEFGDEANELMIETKAALIDAIKEVEPEER